MTRIGILGSGAWGTTIAWLLGQNKHTVTIWSRNMTIIDDINNNHKNSAYLPNTQLPISVSASNNLAEVVTNKDLCIFAIPSKSYTILDSLAHSLDQTTPLLLATKGLTDSQNYVFCSDYAQSIITSDIAVLSGPNLANEIASTQPAASVVASKNNQINQTIQTLLSSSRFRVYSSSDIRGVEFGGIFKNVIAIAAGISDALNLGINSKSALITRGLKEMVTIGTAFGGKKETFHGLSGLGDLMATCYSSMSRNWQYGYQKINSSASIEKPNTVEGIRTIERLYPECKRLGLETPILSEMIELLFNNKSPQKAIESLMSRKLKTE